MSEKKPFVLEDHVIKVQGNRKYLPVSGVLVWFLNDHDDWSIETEPVVIDIEKQYAIFRATVKDETGRIRAQATKMENVRGFADYVEKAETSSVGRALRLCGYGTAFTEEFDEKGRVADAPQNDRGHAQRDHGPANNYAANGNGQGGNGNRPQQAQEGESRECSEEGCQAVLTPAQAQLSQNKFGRLLCPTHQRGAASANGNGAPQAAPVPAAAGARKPVPAPPPGNPADEYNGIPDPFENAG